SWSIDKEGELTAAAFSHDAMHLAVGDADGTIRLYPSDPGQTAATGVSAVLGTGGSPFHALPHLGRLAGRPGALLDLDGFAVTALAWSPDGARLAAGSAAERVHLWDVERGERVWSANSFRGE